MAWLGKRVHIGTVCGQFGVIGRTLGSRIRIPSRIDQTMGNVRIKSLNSDDGDVGVSSSEFMSTHLSEHLGSY